MKFGSLLIDEAKGCILAHSLMLGKSKHIKKGVKLDDAHIAKIKAAGITQVSVARLDAGDVHEDEAAVQLAQNLLTPNLRLDAVGTGRVNIFAGHNGVLRVSKPIIDAINAIDPAITIATLDDYADVNEGRLIATIKIIPYGVSGQALARIFKLDLSDCLALHPYKAKKIGLVATTLASVKPSTLDKTAQVLKTRLMPSRSSIVEELRVEHESQAVADAILKLQTKCDLLIVFGASAISDTGDVIPSGLKKAGGEIIRFGMPVDPGNLMLLGELDGKPVIGAPGCARSPAENGFDWILQRLLADLTVTSDDISKLGVGGVLMETGSRPHPRVKGKTDHTKIAAIILAAGQSRRMGDDNKMTVDVKGKAMVRHVLDAASASKLDSITLVTGHNSEEVLNVLEGQAFTQVHNPNFASGMSSSLEFGISSLDKDITHALLLLGDMPFISTQMIDELIAAAQQKADHIIVATHNHKRGNPVLWPARFFDELCRIEGDVGARHILAANKDRVIEVELGEGVHLDLDTKAAIEGLE